MIKTRSTAFRVPLGVVPVVFVFLAGTTARVEAGGADPSTQALDDRTGKVADAPPPSVDLPPDPT